MLERHLIKHLAPAWFAVIMGTGGLANILFQWQNSFPAGNLLGTLFAILADLLYFVVLVPWVIRWICFFDYAYRDLNHLHTGNFFVTMPVATTILGTNIYLIWSHYLSQATVYHVILGLWIISIIGVCFFTFYSTFLIIRLKESPSPDVINFSWIMAPIANMAVLLIGNPVLELTIKIRPMWGLSFLVINTALFGIGFFLFMFISAIVFVRLANHPLPPGDKIPSFGIFISAIGLAVSAIIDIAKNAHTMGFLGSTELSNLMSMAIWGFGTWIVGIIVIISIYQIRNGGIPFNMGWWAFIFPLASYTIASQKIARIFISPLTVGYSKFLTILLILLWVYTFSNTVRGVLSGKLFIGPQMPSKCD
ncbi:tellurite resistance protein-like permease [Desulfosporosinus acidiphilus SJ4]|uniref:Tellurite resistance protein-like permease n=1 Tax=Desulfosporosinus acidiphilus (strain DSM 22704 / JCM 16185 / SJ4) TaxID=646529 RepID=I4D0E8_DESAJ|nr:C4-dicarboxylate ABC transporter [Desulfosporosinus acidiphilus]AFM39272.1 tellurite resistance protein-like permease [Desulfosporosinus acidiphilus SJ4]